MVSAVFASSLSCDFSRARRAASFTSLNLSENFFRRATSESTGSGNTTLALTSTDVGLAYLMQLLLSSKTQAVHRVGPAVCPLSKLLGRLGKCHAGCNSAVDDCLHMQRQQR